MKKQQKTFKKGDMVKWNTPQGKTKGTIEKKVSATTKVKGHTAKANKQSPEYVVKSRRSGKKAIHKPEQLSHAKSKKI